ncbi:hypothetical protein GOBAR_AA27977 [Gossypium barbadense]|uniref:Endonuclease/exonuclease/phosphatase domain-containing protein n=1 Tax=Gossypium barbadense TaxID=3634 RepID=A0A2P5WNP4_GOSBA|nr:hypothetical protein GOBAR_AA27977 [Gossypium barbadense]
MQNCLAVDSNRKSGGIAMLWRDEVEVVIQNYLSNHIDSLVKVDNMINIRFTGFYGHTDPTARDQSWEILKKIGRIVREEWIIGGDFNVILDDAEKESIDGPITNSNINRLREARNKLSNLYSKEEGYWAQRSRISWLREGDRNTKFFHVRATNRQKQNNIERLKDHSGRWVYDTKGICKIVGNYFQNLFKSSIDYNDEMEMGYIPKCVDHEINNILVKDFTDEEILAAFNQMDPRKAPGIDGLSGVFFRENWEVVGKDILNLCHDFLNGQKDFSCINETIIVLIPKIKEPTNMFKFRPISLCRVIYKIVPKTLTNQLKNVFSSCISQNQNASVSRRMIHDNILIAHELLNYLQR